MPNTYQKFFEKFGDDAFVAINWGSHEPITIEDLYQHFKARMIAEMTAQCYRPAPGETVFVPKKVE